MLTDLLTFWSALDSGGEGGTGDDDELVMLTDLLTFWSSLDSDGEGGTAGSEASDDALVMLTVLCSLIC